MEQEIATALTGAVISPMEMGEAMIQSTSITLALKLVLLLAVLGLLWADRIGKYPNPLSRWLYRYGDDIDAMAELLKAGKVSNPIERAAIVQALARVNAAKIIGVALMFAVVMLP